MLRSALVTALDRPLARPVLAAIGTVYARRLNGHRTLRVFYDRATRSWGRRTPNETIVDGPEFPYYAEDLTLAEGRTPWSAVAHNYWLSRAPVRLGETILDVGAEVGSDVHAFAQAVGPTGRVCAIEAHPVTFQRLQRTVALSALTRVTTHQVAIMGEPGMVYIDDGANSLSATVGTGGHAVRAVTLDRFCQDEGITAVGLLKMNIEGAERDALRGMTETLRRTRQVLIACHDFRAERGDGPFYRTRDEVRAHLAAHGLTVAPVDATKPAYERDHVLAVRA